MLNTLVRMKSLRIRLPRSALHDSREFEWTLRNLLVKAAGRGRMRHDGSGRRPAEITGQKINLEPARVLWSQRAQDDAVGLVVGVATRALWLAAALAFSAAARTSAA
jgi:hypothetical protein